MNSLLLVIHFAAFLDCMVDVQSAPHKTRSAFISGSHFRRIRRSLQQDALWTTWAHWTPCSFTCDRGVRSRYRGCVQRTQGGLVRLADSKCSGPPREYQICEEQPCPVGSGSPKEYQCALKNKEKILDKLHEWIPLHSGVNQCELTCMANGYSFYNSFGYVTDGTPCDNRRRHDDTRDEHESVCINGTCQVVGCDDIVNSGTRLDMCRECGGENVNCYHFRKSYMVLEPPKEDYMQYQDMVLIPEGATYVEVTDQSNNYLALADDTGTFILNGNWMIDWSGKYEVDGTVIMYDRRGMTEILTIEGPTTKNITLKLIFNDRNPGVHYEFYIPSHKSDQIQSAADLKNKGVPRFIAPPLRPPLYGTGSDIHSNQMPHQSENRVTHLDDTTTPNQPVPKSIYNRMEIPLARALDKEGNIVEIKHEASNEKEAVYPNDEGPTHEETDPQPHTIDGSDDYGHRDYTVPWYLRAHKSEEYDELIQGGIPLQPAPGQINVGRPQYPLSTYQWPGNNNYNFALYGPQLPQSPYTNPANPSQAQLSRWNSLMLQRSSNYHDSMNPNTYRGGNALNQLNYFPYSRHALANSNNPHPLLPSDYDDQTTLLDYEFNKLTNNGSPNNIRHANPSNLNNLVVPKPDHAVVSGPRGPYNNGRYNSVPKLAGVQPKQQNYIHHPTVQQRGLQRPAQPQPGNTEHNKQQSASVRNPTPLFPGHLEDPRGHVQYTIPYKYPAIRKIKSEHPRPTVKEHLHPAITNSPTKNYYVGSNQRQAPDKFPGYVDPYITIPIISPTTQLPYLPPKTPYTPNHNPNRHRPRSNVDPYTKPSPTPSQDNWFITLPRTTTITNDRDNKAKSASRGYVIGGRRSYLDYYKEQDRQQKVTLAQHRVHSPPTKQTVYDYQNNFQTRRDATKVIPNKSRPKVHYSISRTPMDKQRTFNFLSGNSNNVDKSVEITPDGEEIVLYDLSGFFNKDNAPWKHGDLGEVAVDMNVFRRQKPNEDNELPTDNDEVFPEADDQKIFDYINEIMEEKITDYHENNILTEPVVIDDIYESVNKRQLPTILSKTLPTTSPEMTTTKPTGTTGPDEPKTTEATTITTRSYPKSESTIAGNSSTTNGVISPIPRRHKQIQTCPKCTKVRDLASNYCQSGIVANVTVQSSRMFEDKTRYKIIIGEIFHHNGKKFNRDYIWVTNTCRCPRLRKNIAYLIVGDIYNGRFLVSHKSYTKRFKARTKSRLIKLNEQCSNL